MSQLNDIAILQPEANLKARSGSKLKHSSDHCLDVASHAQAFFFFFFQIKIDQLFSFLPRNKLAQLAPWVQLVSGCEDCV